MIHGERNIKNAKMKVFLGALNPPGGFLCFISSQTCGEAGMADFRFGIVLYAGLSRGRWGTATIRANLGIFDQRRKKVK
ncbi:MAG: hypothetical protein LWX52_02795 [Deltaproteobacteria bacterium]|nr:hypothetical protein [Deltaproteobacteria bacterium]